MPDRASIGQVGVGAADRLDYIAEVRPAVIDSDAFWCGRG